MKKFGSLFMLLIAVMSFVCAHAQENYTYSPVLLTEEEYSQFTYTWTDAAGTPHTSTLTEKAESTEQIMALIKEVYTNPAIPGNYYGLPHEKEGNSLYGKVDGQWGISSVSKPNQDGYTMILVAMHDDWKKSAYDSKDYKHAPSGGYTSAHTGDYRFINESIKWVRVISNAARIVDDNNAPNHSGVLFNIDDTMNRFYVMTKGKTRATTSSAPFYKMFELFSPTTNDNTADTPNYYNRMMAGEIHNILHDCGSVEGLEHYFAMGGKKGTDSYNTTGLVFYLPDYRYQPWSGRDNNGDYTWYNQNYAPQTLMYTIKLKATRGENLAETTDGSRMYDVTLDWTTSLDQLSPSGTLPQEFDLYYVVNGVRQDTPFATGITEHTYTYQVPQYLEGYEITYQISGRPIGTQFKKAWSNTDKVTIPGYDPFERLELNIDGNYKSTYEQDMEHNKYENLITATNNNLDPEVALKGNMIENGTTFDLYRFDKNLPKEEQVLTHVAVVTMGTKSEVNGKWQFPYTVKYDFEIGDVVYPAKTGYFTAETADGVINMGNKGLQLMDAFYASTAKNDHPDHYDYQIKFKSAIDIEAEDGTTSRDAYSNVVRVPVYKTTTKATATVYTLDQVKSDVNHDLALDIAATIDVTMNRYTNVQNYIVRRDGKVDVGLIQHNADGSYTAFKRDKTGFNTVIDTEEFTGSTLTMSAIDDGRDNTKGEEALTSYVGIISVLTKNTLEEGTVISTYGSDIKRIALANLDLELNADDQVMGNVACAASQPYEFNGELKSVYAVCLNLDAFLSQSLKIYGNGNEKGAPNFRVWRIAEGQETLIDGKEQTYTFHYTNRDGQPDEVDMTFGYQKFGENTDNKNFMIQDSFLGKPLTKGVSNPVTYIARVYAEGTPLVNGNGVKAKEDIADFYIAEASVTIPFEQGIYTGVEDITSRTLTSVTYYNVQGMASSTPFDGMNIAVARYSDGSIKTSRIIK